MLQIVLKNYFCITVLATRAQKNIDEKTLVGLLKNKDQMAYSRLYDMYSGVLYGIVCRILRGEDDAEDVLQDSFVKIWKNIDGYDERKGTLFTWLLNITRNTAIDFLRSKAYSSKNQNQTLDDSVNIIEQNTDNRIKVDNIGVRQAALSGDEKYSAIIEKLYFEGYTHEEAAKELGIPVGTLKTRLRAALLDLRKVLKLLFFWT